MAFGKDKHESEGLGERIKEKVKDVFGKNDDDKQTSLKTGERLSNEAGDDRRANVPINELHHGTTGPGAGGVYGSSAAGGAYGSSAAGGQGLVNVPTSEPQRGTAGISQGLVNVPTSELQHGTAGISQGRVNVPTSELQQGTAGVGAGGVGTAYGSSAAEGAGGRVNVAGQEHGHHHHRHQAQHGTGLTSSQYGDASRINAPGNDGQFAGGAYGTQQGVAQRGSGHEEQGLLGRAKEAVKDTLGSGDRDSRGTTASGYETRSKTSDAAAGYGQRVGQVDPQVGLSPQQGAYTARREL